MVIKYHPNNKFFLYLKNYHLDDCMGKFLKRSSWNH